MKTLILDNGAYEIKAGFAGSQPSYQIFRPSLTVLSVCYSLVPNCIARSKGDRRVYVGDQLRNCKDYGALAFKRPFDRVHLSSLSILMTGVFDELGDGEDGVGHYPVRWRETGTPPNEWFVMGEIEPAETSLLVTEPPLDLPVLQASYDQMVFEEFEFHSYCRTTGTV
jgi:actin-related protein 6